jgi:S-adenosyl methyltransferase
MSSASNTPTDHPPATGTSTDHGYRPPIDTSRPHPARRYDYWLGGKDNFAADRASGDRIADAFPTIRTAAVENRRFMQRAVRYLAAEAGVRQFLDVGTGIPTSPNVHEVAQQSAPSSRVVYVDNDPMVVVHARALMTSDPQGATAYLQADLRDPGTILASPELTTTLDLHQAVALLLVAVLHFLDDTDHPAAAVGRLVQALPTGSYLVLSHATLDPLPGDTRQRIADLASPDSGNGPFRPRSREEVAAFLAGLELVDPGLVPIVQWRPHLHPRPGSSIVDTTTYGAVARVP